MTRSVRPLKVTKTRRERKENDSKQQTNSLDSTTNEYAQQSLYTRFFFVSFFSSSCVCVSHFFTFLKLRFYASSFDFYLVFIFQLKAGCIFLYINRLLCAAHRVCCVFIASGTEESWIQNKISN